MQKKGQETRSHILRESRRLFTLQGFQNTSISEIIAVTGVKKGNLYYHFSSKEELGLAVLSDAADEFFTILENSFSGYDCNERILASCQVIMDLMQQTNFVGGCLFGNTALEMSDSTPRFREIIRDVFDRWIAVITQELGKHSTSGEADGAQSQTDSDLAVAIVALLEGGIMLSRVYRNQESLTICIDAVSEMLQYRE